MKRLKTVCPNLRADGFELFLYGGQSLPDISRIIFPAIIYPATGGTKETLPGGILPRSPSGAGVRAYGCASSRE